VRRECRVESALWSACADAAESWRRLAKQTKAVMPYETSGR
jgi:hypothetical protein